MTREVIRQEVLWIPESRQVPWTGNQTAKDMRIWTLPFYDEAVKPELPYSPVHHHNAFLEDYVHDWIIWKGALRYASRVSTGGVWVLIEHLKVQKPGTVPSPKATKAQKRKVRMHRF